MTRLNYLRRKNKKWYIPFTPAGSCLAHLKSNSEAKAWEKLLKDAAHMPYDGIEGFKQRGYTVEEFSDEDIT